jgi:hypothetical protein
MERKLTIEEYLYRDEIIKHYTKIGAGPKTIRLLKAIFGTDDECDDFIFRATKDEIDIILIKEGFDLEELDRKLKKGIEEIKLKFRVD